MNDLNLIIVLAAWLAVVVSIWMIVFFSARIITHYRIRRALGDMPSPEELHAWYEKNYTDAITRIEHSPIEKNLRS